MPDLRAMIQALTPEVPLPLINTRTTANGIDAAGNVWVYQPPEVELFQAGGAGGPFLPLSGGTMALTQPLVVTSPTAFPNQVIFDPVPPSAANVSQASQLNSFLVSQTTGGNFYDMYCNIRADTTIQGSGSTGITGVLSQMTYNGDGGSGGYVPFYGQFSRRTVNPGGAAQNPQIWGAVFEVIDWTNTDSAQTNYMSGIEIDMTVGNTDSVKNRRALGIYLNPANGTDVVPVCDLGIHVAANQGSFNRMIATHGLFNEAAFDLREAVASTTAAHGIWLGSAGTIAMDTPASVTLGGDTTGGIVVQSTATHPARFIYQANGGTGEQWWAGAWTDGSFYIADYTSSVNRLTITSAGSITLNGPTFVDSLTLPSGNPISFDPANTVVLQELAGTLVCTREIDIVTGSGTPARTVYNGAQNYWVGAWMDGNFYVSGPGGNRLEITPPGGMMFNGTSMGFFGTTPIAKPTVTGSAGGNAALDSLIAALAAYGLIVNNTTP